MERSYGEMLNQMEKDKQELEALAHTNKMTREKLKYLDLLDQIIEKQRSHMATQPDNASGSAPQSVVSPGLLSELVPVMMGLQEFGPLMEAYKVDTDPKRQIVSKIFGGSPVNMIPGGTPAAGAVGGEPGAGGGQPGAGGMNDFASLIEAAAKGDPNALSQLGALDMAGLGDLNKYVSNLQVAKQGYHDTIFDPKTGMTYSGVRNKITHEWIPGTLQPAPNNFSWQDVVDEEGGTSKVPFIGGVPVPGGVPGGIPTKKPEVEAPIPMDDLSLWRNATDLGSPPPGISPKEAEKRGYRRISTNAATKIDSLRSAKGTLKQVLSLMKEVFPIDKKTGQPLSESPFWGRAKGAIDREGGAMTQMNIPANKLKGLLEGTLAQNVRAMGDVGAMTEGDMQRARSLSFSLTDRADVAWEKVRGLEELFNKIQREVLGSGGAQKIQRQPGESAADFLRRKRAGGQ